MASDLSFINIPRGFSVFKRVYNALKQINIVSAGSQDLGLQRASIHIPEIQNWLNFLLRKLHNL